MSPPSQTSGFISAEHLLAAIVDSSEDAIVSKSLDGIITSWNRAAERLFGYTAEEMMGQSVLKIIPTERHGEETTIVRQLKNGERIELFETQRLNKSGQRIQVSLTISPVRSASGEIVGASKIVRDISEKQRAEQALREATEAIAQQNRIKDEFLATLSHELRTPLQSILGWVQLLKGEEIENPEVAEGLEVIARNARVQQRIIEDMLDMNRILAGKVRIELVPVFLPAVIQAALETVRPALETRQIQLVTEIDQNPATGIIKGDPHRLQQVFWNLLNNAVKFTPPGGHIWARLKRTDAFVEVTVEDSGIGIDAPFLPYVFDRFRQADASATRPHGGLGLGLAIVRNLVELHGGAIVASSPGSGQGSRFVVKLPLMISPASSVKGRGYNPSQPTIAAPAAHGIAAQVLSGLSIAIVDDDQDSRDVLEKTLTKAGATVTALASVDETLSHLKSIRPDILVSDIAMPERSGYSLLQTLRTMPAEKGGNIPAVALSAYTRPEDKARALTAGFQACHSKPLNAEELVQCLVQLTRH